MKKQFIAAALCLLSVGVVSSCGNASSTSASSTAAKTKIGILQVITHSALGKAQQGFKDELAAKGFDDSKVEFDVEIPEGDSATETSMASKLATNSGLVLGIATSSSLALKNAVSDLGKKTPVLFTAVTDPVAAGLVTSFTEHANVVGTSDNVPTDTNIELFKEFSITKIGVLYNTGEENSQIQVKEAKTACEKYGITLVEGGITASSEIDSSLQGMISQGIKGLFVPTDNMIANAFTNIADTLKTNKIISVCADGNMTDSGGALGFGVDYYKLGQKTGDMAASILGGTDISTISCAVSDSFPLSLNQQFFTDTGIAIPDSVKSKLSN
jgi:putative tryptophan/tyrosine transport system substrate-binding protein